MRGVIYLFIIFLFCQNIINSCGTILNAKVGIELLLGERQVDVFGRGIFEIETPLITPAERSPVSKDYIIGRGDAFRVYIWGKVEEVHEVKVNREGQIYLPRVGILQVEGLKLKELEDILYKAYSKFYVGFKLTIVMTQLKPIRVYILGEAKTPGTYEFFGMVSVINAIYKAGGISQKGSLRNIKLIRNDEIIKEIDLYSFLLSGDKSIDVILQPEDIIYIPLSNFNVAILGHIRREAIYEFKEEERPTLGRLIELAGGFLATADKERIQIERVENNQRILIELSAREDNNFVVKDGDIVTVFPIIEKFRDYVLIEGEVYYPGKYSIRESNNLKDILLKACIKESAYLKEAKIIRRENNTKKVSQFNVEDVLLDKLNIKLFPEDRICIYREEPVIDTTAPLIEVEISGEVNKPGKYYLLPNVYIADLIKQAGGLTEYAYPQATELYNPLLNTASLHIDRLLSLQKFMLLEYSEIVKPAELEQIIDMQKNRVTIGKIILRLPNDINKMPPIKICDKDHIYIPPIPNFVTVIGEVYNPGQVYWQENKNIYFYLHHCGFFTKYADKKEIYIIKADGSIIKGKTMINNYHIMPGDTIVVPYEFKLKQRFLPVLKDVVTTLWYLVTAISVVR